MPMPKITKDLFENREKLEFEIRLAAHIETNYESDFFLQLDESKPEYTSKQEWREYRLALERMLDSGAAITDD